VVVGVCLLTAAGCDGQGAAGSVPPRSDSVDQSSLPVTPSEPILNLGEVPAGGQKQRDFWLTNRTGAPVEVVEIETSCDCLKIDLPTRVLLPAQKIAGSAALDLRKEPGSTGNLGIEVTGKARSGKVVFTLVVKVVVGGD